MKKDIITQKAKAVLEENEIFEYPVKIVNICKKYGFSVFEEYLPENVLGFIVVQEENFSKYNTGKLIAVNLSDLATRRRLTIARELGHFFLHRKNDDKIYAHRNTGIEDQFEMEANLFALNILLPEALVIEAMSLVEELLVNYPDFFKIDYIAKQFAVSKVTAQYRLKQLGII